MLVLSEGAVSPILIYDPYKRFYLQEDLGDTLLFHAIEKGRQSSVFSPEERALLKKTIWMLPAFQYTGAQGFDFSRCHLVLIADVILYLYAYKLKATPLIGNLAVGFRQSPTKS